MKLAEMGGNQPAGVVEMADPVVADNYAKVKVFSAPLCTEFKLQDRPRRGGFGHEAAGEVVEIGPNARKVAVGDRVVVMPQSACGICEWCRAGDYIHCPSPRDARKICGSKTGREAVAQYVIQQDWLLVKIPDGMPYDHAAMACCGFGPAFNAMQSMEVSEGDTVLVSGLGPVGLGAVIVALSRGARVIGLDVSEYRCGLAQQIGAQLVLNPEDQNVREQIMTATPGGLGVHKCIHATRLDEAAKFLMDVVRRRGRVAFIGQGGTIDIGAVVGKGLRLYGCWHWNHLKDTEQMMATIRESGKRIDTMITHTFPIDRIAEALELQVSGRCGKAIIHPWEENRNG